MLTRLDLRHFKCFKLLKLPLCPLTLLSGANASGKSSVIQALVLLHQTMREHEWSSRLMLNGTAISMGTAADVIDKIHGRREFGISLCDGKVEWFGNTDEWLEEPERFEWEFEGERDEMSMAVRKVRGESFTEKEEWKKEERDKDDAWSLHHLLPTTFDDSSLIGRMCRLTYLTAERLGPREYYAHDDPQLTPVVGSRGEYAVSILHSRRDDRVLAGVAKEDIPPTLFHQVEARMAEFFPDCVLAIEQVPRTNALTLGIRTSKSTDFHRPAHTGFGLTQVLPIVVAAMSSDRGDILLIENPEVHLHPAGQAMMGKFLAQVTSAGVQVMVETHSDHVLNGIRRAVKDGVLPSDDVALHFFRPPGDTQAGAVAQVESPTIDTNGNIDSWPEGFFDQFDKDINHFAGWD